MSELLIEGIVRVLDSNGEIAGTGFVVSESGLIATCSHVVQHETLQDAGEPRPERVTIVFHATGDERDAHVEPSWWLPWDAGDLAVLRVEGLLPQGVQPLPLGFAEGTGGHDICTFGFPDIDVIEGIGGDGKIVRSLSRAGRSLLQLRSNEITAGFSGAPVWDKLKRRVVGVISAITEPDRHHRLTETAFAISTETLQQLCPHLQLWDICPYLGLTAFGEEDAEFFFGREQMVESILHRLRQEPRFLALLGPSGSGKSSVAQAGVLPQLRKGKVPGSDHWEVIVSRPGTNPFDKLAEAGLADGQHTLTECVQAWLRLRPERERLVLVLDQFEELFVTCSNETCQSFVQQLTDLLHSSLPVSLILVMRDDFYSRLAQSESLMKWVEDSRGALHISQLLRQNELAAIIQKPAEAVGLRCEEGLVEVIVRDAMEASVEAEGGGQAGRSTVLPLLEFALSELWERRQEGMLTHEAYMRIGAVAGALTQWADRAFFGLKSEEQQHLAHRIFTDLIYLGDKDQGILDSRRRRALLSLSRHDDEQQDVQEVVQQLVENRLLVTDRDIQTNSEVVEIIHDVLLRTWGRLKHWVEEDRDFLQWHQKLEGKVQEWIETDSYHPDLRDADKLLGKRDLIVVKEWQQKRKGDLGLSERTFIEASEQRQRKLANRRRVLSSVLSLLSVVALVLASVAEINFQRAQTQSQVAASQKAIAASRQLATRVTDHLDDNLALALLLSVEANHVGSTQEARSSLLSALEHQPHLAGWLSTGASGLVVSPGGVAFSPDSKTLAVGGQDQTFTFWDVMSQRPISAPIHDQLVAYTPDQTSAPVTSLAFSPNGKILATGTDFFGGMFRLWDVQSRLPISGPITVPRGVSDLAFNPRGDTLVIASTDGTFSFWDVATRKLSGPHRSWGEAGGGHEIRSRLAFSPDGTLLAVSNNDAAFSLPGTFTLWDVRSQQLLGTHQANNRSNASPLAFSPDSKLLAVGGEYGSTTLWDVKSQLPVGTPLTNTTVSKTVGSVAESSPVTFTPTGQFLAVGSSNGSITFWNMATYKPVDEINTNTALTDMIFSPDGSRLATIGDGKQVGLWHVLPYQPLAHLVIGAGKPVEPFISPGGTQSGYVGGYYRTFSSDGYTIAVMYCHDASCSNATTYLWSSTGHQLSDKGFAVPSDIDKGYTPSVAISSDRKFFAMAGTGTACVNQQCKIGELYVWNVASHELIYPPLFTESPLDQIAFSPDGSILAASSSGGSDGTIYLWNMATGQLLGHIPSIMSRTFAFKPGSDILAASYCSHFTQGACDHTQIGLWDSRTPTSKKQVIGDTTLQYLDHIRWNPTGSLLVTTAGDNEIVLWDAATGKRLRELKAAGSLSPLAFTPDGTMLVIYAAYCTAFNDCRDSAIQLLDVNTLNAVGPPLAIYSNYNVEFIQLTNNTGSLYGWSLGDGMVVSWDFNTTSWQTLACQMANRNLTFTEWKQFMGSLPYQKTCMSLPGPSDKG